MKKYIFVLGVAVSVFFTGCGKSENSETSTSTANQKLLKLLELEATDKIPSLDRTSTIEGIDSDGNGVRDDIEEYIDSTYIKTEQKSAVLQAAKAMQEALLADKTDSIAVKEVAYKNVLATKCIYLKFSGGSSSKEPSLVASEIETITTNTKLRLLEYLELNKALDGTSWSLPVGDTCE